MNKYLVKKSIAKKDWFRFVLPIFILCYILFLVGKSSISNLNINQKIYQLQEEVENIKDENKEFEELNAYYKSDSYKEKQARLKLGYAKPGEFVIIIPSEKSEDEQNLLIAEKTEITKIDEPNWKNWINYFFQ